MQAASSVTLPPPLNWPHACSSCPAAATPPLQPPQPPSQPAPLPAAACSPLQPPDGSSPPPCLCPPPGRAFLCPTLVALLSHRPPQHGNSLPLPKHAGRSRLLFSSLPLPLPAPCLALPNVGLPLLERLLWRCRNQIYNTPALTAINKLVRLVMQGCGAPCMHLGSARCLCRYLAQNQRTGD